MKDGRDILGDYGPDHNGPQRSRATNGGQMPVKEIPYCPPQGPSNINDGNGPGLHGTNHGICGTQGKH